MLFLKIVLKLINLEERIALFIYIYIFGLDLIYFSPRVFVV